MKKVYIVIFISMYMSANAQNTDELPGEKWNISKGIIQPKSSVIDPIAVKYWNYINDKLPAELIKKYVYSLRLFSDGKEEELGEMSPLNDLNSKWEIALDTIDFNFNTKDSLHIIDYTHTIIHEFGHLLTLNPEQVEITDDVWQDEKKGYLTSEGYATSNSYLEKFVTLFWDEKLLRKWDKIDNIRNENRKINLLYKFYLKNKNQFVTDYSAESPEEDIAESWTFFVLSDKPILNTIKHKKVLFFYDFPELITYRNRIRKKIELIPVDYINNIKLDPSKNHR